MSQLPTDGATADPMMRVMREASENRFGMWLFLAMEMLFFGTFFMLFAASFHQHATDFKIASHHLNLTIAIANTAILLTSSLCMAIAVLLAQHQPGIGPQGEASNREFKERPMSRWRLNSSRPWLLLTAMFGIAFLFLKLFEYRLDARDGILPFINYAPNFQSASAVYLFYSLYFFVTLIHFAHLTIGCVWVSALALKNEGPHSAGRTEIAGLYWHFVDVVWIVLLPTLYLLQ